MMPSAPAFDTAEASWARAMYPIGAWRIGYSTPSNSVRRFRIAARYRHPMPSRPDAKPGRTPTVRNRRARYNYQILETFECGIVLGGSEVKSLRAGRANLQDAYARVVDGEVWLHGMHVAPYEFARDELDPDRPRKLLLHRREIDQLARATSERGMTLVPLRTFFKDHRVKVDLAVARGKRAYDKRRTLAERDAKRDMERALKGQRD